MISTKTTFMFLCVALAQGIGPVGFGAVQPGTNAPAPGVPLSTNEMASIRIAASNSLVTLRRHITPLNYQFMGFGTTNEILRATNGEPLLVFTVPLNQLTNYQAGSDFNMLLESAPQTGPGPRVIIPIMVGTNVRSSSTLRFIQGAAGMAGRWVEDDWGRPNLIRNLVATYHAITNSEVRAGTVPFAVEIPMPRIWVVGYYNTQNKLIFRATTDLHLGPITIKRNQIITPPAMEKMTTEARRYDASLPN